MTSSRLEGLAPGLARLCDRQVEQPIADEVPKLIHACVIAARFGSNTGGVGEPVSRLRKKFSDVSPLRRAAFWAELSLMDEIMPSDDDWVRFFNVERNSLLDLLQQSDRPWLEAALVATASPERRPVALHALIQLWRQTGGDRTELEALRRATPGDAALTAILKARAALPGRNRRREKMQERQRRRQLLESRRKKQHLENLRNWRGQLLADPAATFSETTQENTIRLLYNWLQAQSSSRSRYDVWNAMH